MRITQTPAMTDQEVFNTVARHLFTQGEQARDELGCVYRTSTGKKCAVGCLIPDEVYNPDWEGVPIEDLPKDILPTSNIPLLKGLQNVHDYNLSWKSRKALFERLYLVAVTANLSTYGLYKVSRLWSHK